MEAVRRGINDFLVVGRCLSAFQVNPWIVVDKLHATLAWRLLGMVTIQEVASGDGRFILNFSTEEDWHFALKAQSWHFKRGGIIFVEFDDKGNPAEVNLGVMPISVQGHDLPFELKTESMG
ncbi:hypothetical protein ZWY2020_028658 [Hordeum vulgare]|nr:hypothetical protein ZWY2020_028658 [Hordeum vulgare]